MKHLSIEELSGVTGGMRWEEFRRSTNVEDRRPASAIARDNAWWKSMEAPRPAAKDDHVR